MAEYRQIHTRIWKDAWFFELSSDDKLLFIYLFSNERANVTGLYDLHKRIISFETGLTQKVVEKGFDTFEAAGKVYYDSGWIWIPNLLKYNTASLKSDRIRTHINNFFEKTPNIPLKIRCIEYYNGMVEEEYRIHTPYMGYKTMSPEHEHEQELDLEPELEMKESGAKLAPSLSHFQELKAYWTELFPLKPKPRATNSSAPGKVVTRMKSPHFVQNWRAAMFRASKSNYLGLKETTWFDFLWFVKTVDNYEACLNGKYDFKPGAPRTKPPPKITTITVEDM